MFKNFACDNSYFKLYPVFNWKPMKFFSIGGDMGTLGKMGDNPTERVLDVLKSSESKVSEWCKQRVAVVYSTTH